jgi:ribosomal protein S18 acetylase RimI-like enzyme
MASLTRPNLILPSHSDFREIANWKFPETHAFVTRIFTSDIPQRVQDFRCRIWAFRDTEGRLVGFGTIDLCNEHAAYTNGQRHPYIPLLAVHPEMGGQGIGEAIVRHLIGDAVLLVRGTGCHDALLLDVYEDNIRAVKLYQRCGFKIVGDPVFDPIENKNCLIMAQRVSIASK